MSTEDRAVIMPAVVRHSGVERVNADYIERDRVEGRRAMVHREKVTDAKGRQWVSGKLDADVYFADVRRRARAQAEKIIAARVNGAGPGSAGPHTEADARA